MRTILAKTAYDGTDFAGYQVQNNQRTVQGELERALAELHGHRVTVAAAGRTDSGVHADGQYISFVTDHRTIPTERMAAAINSRLPKDVAVIHAREVPEGFHARFSAVSRHYRYHLLVSPVQLPHTRRYTWRIPHMPDVERVCRDAAALVGEHDFTTFAAKRCESDTMVRRVLYADLRCVGNRLEFAVGADGFLWRMVRSIVGTLMEREERRRRGEAEPAPMRTLLERKDRTLSGTTAPAWGLFLHDVEYDL